MVPSALLMRYNSCAETSFSSRVRAATLCLLSWMPSFCRVGCSSLLIELIVGQTTYIAEPCRLLSKDEHYLQTPVVVEDCGWGSAVFELTEIRLQVASVKYFAKNKAACKVLQEQCLVRWRPSLRCKIRHPKMRLPSPAECKKTGSSNLPLATLGGERP